MILTLQRLFHGQAFGPFQHPVELYTLSSFYLCQPPPHLSLVPRPIGDKSIIYDYGGTDNR